jgi:DnaJ-class molecular chaperone
MKCQDCNGHGFTTEPTYAPCRTCGGVGYVYRNALTRAGAEEVNRLRDWAEEEPTVVEKTTMAEIVAAVAAMRQR